MGNGRWDIGFEIEDGKWEMGETEEKSGEGRYKRKQGTGNREQRKRGMGGVCDGEQQTRRFSLDRFPFARTKVLRLSIY
jgi:hypothetical protein